MRLPITIVAAICAFAAHAACLAPWDSGGVGTCVATVTGGDGIPHRLGAYGEEPIVVGCR